VWDRTFDGNYREFLGCGAAFLPSSTGYHAIDIKIWKPTLQESELTALSGIMRMWSVYLCSMIIHATESLLSGVPDVKYLRELIVKPYLRSEVLVILYSFDFAT